MIDGENGFAAALERLPNLARGRDFTNERLEKMRALIANRRELEGILIGTFGSYARREASMESDLDFFAICLKEDQIASAKEVLVKIAPELVRVAGRPPSKDGAFGEVEDIESILRNIGGNDDLNQKITRPGAASAGGRVAE